MNRAPRKSSDSGSRPPASQPDFLSAWRWWLAPALVALALALAFQDPFVGDWDALDYTVNAVGGHPSTMALGRTLFIFVNHALYLFCHTLFNLQPARAYLLFKYTIIALSPVAVIACWQLTRDLTRSVRSATIAALLIALSPAFVIYSGQVMTEIPSLLLLTLALVVHLRGVRRRSLWLMLAGAALLGAGVNARETVGFYAPWLFLAPFVCGWKARPRELLLIALSGLFFLLFALGGFAFWFITDIDGYRAGWLGWRESMRAETARHPVMLRNMLPLLVYFFLVAPMVFVALPVAGWKEWRRHRLSPLLALACVGLGANLLLFFNYSTTINWRYLLTGLPALVPLVGNYFIHSQTIKLGNPRRAFWSAVAGVVFITLVLGLFLRPSREKFIETHALTRDYLARLSALPADAVVLAGGQTVAVTYWRGLGLGRWEAIGTGGGWPGARLTLLIEDYLRAGRPVFLDADPRLWSPCGWQAAETRIIAEDLASRFRFRHLSETIYEIRPATDLTARDTPDLHSLLPEQRPEELKQCAAQRSLN